MCSIGGGDRCHRPVASNPDGIVEIETGDVNTPLRRGCGLVEGSPGALEHFLRSARRPLRSGEPTSGAVNAPKLAPSARPHRDFGTTNIRKLKSKPWTRRLGAEIAAWCRLTYSASSTRLRRHLVRARPEGDQSGTEPFPGCWAGRRRQPQRLHERCRRAKVSRTEARSYTLASYKKNDQAFVEQKNGLQSSVDAL